MAQLRYGTLKINVELGKMSGLPGKYRRECPICTDGSLEVAHVFFRYNEKVLNTLCKRGLPINASIAASQTTLKVVCELKHPETTCQIHEICNAQYFV